MRRQGQKAFRLPLIPSDADRHDSSPDCPSVQPSSITTSTAPIASTLSFNRCTRVRRLWFRFDSIFLMSFILTDCVVLASFLLLLSVALTLRRTTSQRAKRLKRCNVSK